MHIIENFKILMSADHIAWSDGPGWLLGLVVAWVVMGIFATAVSR